MPEHEANPDRDPVNEGEVFELVFPAMLTAVVTAEPGGGYSAEVPALPGCVTEAETLDGLRSNLGEAVAGWLKAMGRPEGGVVEVRAVIRALGPLPQAPVAEHSTREGTAG